MRKQRRPDLAFIFAGSPDALCDAQTAFRDARPWPYDESSYVEVLIVEIPMAVLSHPGSFAHHRGHE